VDAGVTLLAVICDDCILTHHDRLHTLRHETETYTIEGRCICCDGDGFVLTEVAIPDGDVREFSEEKVPCPCCTRNH
jgi:hypothetical protein